MNIQKSMTRAIALLSVGLLVAVSMSPVVAAQSQLNVRSVGDFFVDAQGRASGQNIVTSIAETEGVLTSFMSIALSQQIFSSVSIDGFAQAEKIQGVGSSTLLLKGDNAVVALYDNINTAVKVTTTKSTSLHYELSSGVRATMDSSTRGVVDLYGQGNAYLGSIVAVGADAKTQAEAIVVSNGKVRIDTQAGSQVVFLAKPVYLQSEAYQEAIVKAAAKGQLAATYVTEFEGSAVAHSQVDYASTYYAKTSAAAHGTLHTEVKGRAEAAAVVAYDLAYETLPARSANEVAVYANGQLAARVESAAQVAAYAQQGMSAYYAVVQNGRAQIIASTPDFQSAAEHRLTISANARASTEAQAQAENRAESESRAYGDFSYHGNGKLTGEFLTSVLAEGHAQLFSYTSLASGTEIFKSVSVDGAASSQFRAVDDHRFQVEGPNADLTVVDDVYATLLVDAKAKSEVAFDLAADVKARALSSNVIVLEGPKGYAGALVLAESRAQGSAQASSNLVANAEGQVKAHLEGGARLIFRGAAQAEASEEIVAKAIAQGEIGAQVLAGIQGSAVAATSTEYYSSVVAEVEAKARGSFQVEYMTKTEAAKSFVFDSRGTSLAAKAASDVRVLVDGKAAIPASSAAAALQASAHAKYYAETNLDGSVRVLVNTAAQAGAAATVLIESKLDAAAKASANTDAFGQFKLYPDGTAVGSFVTLKSDQKAGAVSDFTMMSAGQAMFSSIAAGSSSFFSAGADATSVLALENREAKMEFSDTTSGFMKIVAKQKTDVAFRLAAQLDAQAKSANVIELTTKEGAHVASMIITSVEGKAALASSFQTNAEGQIKAHLEQGAQILFKTHVGIEAELSAAQRTMINQAIAQGQVAGQVFVQTEAAMSSTAHAAADAQARLEATARTESEGASESVAIAAAKAYGTVTAAVTANYHGDVQMLTAATKERVDVTISSTSEVGKTIIISLDPATIEGMAQGNAVILFDGKAATQASSYADILNANDDAGVAEYFVLAGEAGTQVLVSVPHFSVHTVTLQERETSSTPYFAIATVFLGIVVLAETVVLVRQRRA